MNKYGKLAQDHWTSVDPQRVQQIENPKAFFSDLGEQVENQIVDLQPQIAGPDKPGETYLQKVGRLNMAKLQAEEMVLHEMVWLTPDPDEEETAAEEERREALHREQRRRELDEEEAEIEAAMDEQAAERQMEIEAQMNQDRD